LEQTGYFSFLPLSILLARPVANRYNQSVGRGINAPVALSASQDLLFENFSNPSR
jgi:hypothetical protein